MMDTDPSRKNERNPFYFGVLLILLAVLVVVIWELYQRKKGRDELKKIREMMQLDAPPEQDDGEAILEGLQNVIEHDRKKEKLDGAIQK
jgi:cytochrome c-type biogenesis protein CcmH/NrfG